MKSQMKIGSALSYISVFLNIAVSFFISPLTVKSLGQAQYGLYQLIWSFVGYMAVLDFGITNSVVRYVAKYRAQKDDKAQENFLAMVLIIYALICIIIVAVGSVLYFNLSNIFGKSLSVDEINLAKKLFVIMIINLSINIFMNVFPAAINAYERFIFQRVLAIIKIFVRTAVIITILLTRPESLVLVTADTILVIIFFSISAAYAFGFLKIKIKLHKFNFSFFKEIFSYSFFIFLAMIVDQANWKIDQFIIGLKMGAASVAVYSIAIQFPYYYTSFAGAISGVLLPRATKMVANGDDNEKFTDFMITTGRAQWLIIGIIPLGFALFGKQFLYLWMGENFVKGYYVSLIIMISLTIPLFQSAGISIQQAKKKHSFRAVVLSIIAIVNVILTYFLVDIFGIIGAASATAFALILGNVIIMNIYYKRTIKLNMLRFYKDISKGLLISTVFMIALGLLLNLLPGSGWINLFSKIAVFIIAYLPVYYFFGLNQNEKNMYFGGLKKFLPRRIGS